MRAILILNPTSGSSVLATEPHEAPELNEEAILSGLRTYDIEPEVRYTTLEVPGRELARQAAEEHVDLVIAAGGDGTIHSVATGLIGTESILGIIPMGTMNNLAHSLGIPDTIEAACAIVGQGETHAIDIGKLNDQYFLEVAGIGLEAALFPAAEEIKSGGLLSTLRGVLGGLHTLFSFQTTKLKISFDDHKSRSYDAIEVTICNAPYYGAHLQAAPDALMDDGLLDVVIYRHFSKLEYIQHAISISKGRRVFQPKISRRRAKIVRISAEQPVAIQTDGLPHGHTPVLVSVVPNALCVRVPKVNAPGFNAPGLRHQSKVETKPQTSGRR